MFTGIIEALGIISHLKVEDSNLHVTISSPISDQLTIDQSVSHNGICLTVVSVSDSTHTVTAINETLRLTTMESWRVGDAVNLERCLQLGDRLDGHLVQGHVDTTAECISIVEEQGSWRYKFVMDASYAPLIIPKGSITINGISLTVVTPEIDTFEVAIIPYTYEHTMMHLLMEGQRVNLEFDILGKYLERKFSLRLMQGKVLP